MAGGGRAYDGTAAESEALAGNGLSVLGDSL